VYASVASTTLRPQKRVEVCSFIYYNISHRLTVQVKLGHCLISREILMRRVVTHDQASSTDSSLRPQFDLSRPPGWPPFPPTAVQSSI